MKQYCVWKQLTPICVGKEKSPGVQKGDFVANLEEVGVVSANSFKEARQYAEEALNLKHVLLKEI